MRERGITDTCLHNTLDPSFLVIVLVAHERGFRATKVSVKEVEVVSKHDHQPSRGQHQIKLLLSETHDFSFLGTTMAELVGFLLFINSHQKRIDPWCCGFV
jgi:hypothetical protein